MTTNDRMNTTLFSHVTINIQSQTKGNQPHQRSVQCGNYQQPNYSQQNYQQQNYQQPTTTDYNH